MLTDYSIIKHQDRYFISEVLALFQSGQGPPRTDVGVTESQDLPVPYCL